jgi:hypothetical protein
MGSPCWRSVRPCGTIAGQKRGITSTRLDFANATNEHVVGRVLVQKLRLFAFRPLPLPPCLVLAALLLFILGNNVLLAASRSAQRSDAHPLRALEFTRKS